MTTLADSLPTVLTDLINALKEARKRNNEAIYSLEESNKKIDALLTPED